jgi:copper chaperone
MTLTHTFGTIFFLLGVVAHLGALIFKVNRPLVKSIFTGGICGEYVRDRHTLWYDELMRKDKTKAQVRVKDEVNKELKSEVRAEVEAKTEPSPQGREIKKSTDRSGKEESDMASVLKVKGMSCQHCVMSVKKALGQVEGIQNVEVDVEKGEVRFENTKSVALNRVEKAIEDAGYQVIQN